MINNPEIIDEIIENIKKIPKEKWDEVMAEIDKNWEEATKRADEILARKEVENGNNSSSSN